MSDVSEDREVVTNQVAGGFWQARFHDGAPNEVGHGSTPEEATAQLKSQTPQGVSDLTTVDARLTQHVGATVDRIVIKKLISPVKNTEGKSCSHVAFRESNPALQGLGSDETSAKVNFLLLEKNRTVYQV